MIQGIGHQQRQPGQVLVDFHPELLLLHNPPELLHLLQPLHLLHLQEEHQHPLQHRLLLHLVQCRQHLLLRLHQFKRHQHLHQQLGLWKSQSVVIRMPPEAHLNRGLHLLSRVELMRHQHPAEEWLMHNVQK